MLVSHRKRFIYTKTMKTAGTSRGGLLRTLVPPGGAWSPSHYRDESVTEAGSSVTGGRTCALPLVQPHLPAAEIRRASAKDRTAYFKFCVVRNPFDRVVSAFHFHERAGATAPGADDRPVAEEGSPNPAEVIRRFRDWVRAGGTVPDLDTYVVGGRLAVDFVIRFESLFANLETVCERVGVPYEPASLPRLKAGYRPRGMAPADYYDRETETIVADRFRFDLEELGYRSPLAASQP
ncbi:MAG: sulfotransferase family 2 domain-containing protein [Candidatus Eisenbacteria bacterium]|nr:sulfotransferase family 2 domain-containing protein [Candidatus Eisenbacteria bacterium]